MNSVTISICSLRVKNNAERGGYYDLDKLPLRHKRKGHPASISLLHVLTDYLLRLRRLAKRDEDNLCLLTASNIQVEPRSISAFLKRGEYGVQNDLFHVRKKEITYHRSVEDAEMMPYYLLAVVPKGSDRGIIAFQAEADVSIKGYFKQCFEDFLRQKCGDCDLELDRLVPKKLVRQYINSGRVARLRFIHLKVPKTIEDAYMLGNIAKDATIELQVKAKRGSAFLLSDSLKSLLPQYKPGRDGDFVQIQGFEFDTVKVDVEVDGNYRTIDMADPTSFRADYNVTNKVLMQGGHPTYKSIDQAAREIVREILHSLRMDQAGV